MTGTEEQWEAALESVILAASDVDTTSDTRFGLPNRDEAGQQTASPQADEELIHERTQETPQVEDAVAQNSNMVLAFMRLMIREKRERDLRHGKDKYILWPGLQENPKWHESIKQGNKQREEKFILKEAVKTRNRAREAYYECATCHKTHLCEACYDEVVRSGGGTDDAVGGASGGVGGVGPSDPRRAEGDENIRVITPLKKRYNQIVGLVLRHSCELSSRYCARSTESRVPNFSVSNYRWRNFL